jgi:hypothetical protein
MFSYNQIRQVPKLLLATTSLTQAEFERLLPFFREAWDEYVAQNFIERESRERRYGGGQRESTLVDPEDKLLFILYYAKAYPLQEILAYEFGMAQSTANEWIHILTGVLRRALEKGGHSPGRDPKELAETLRNENEKTYGIDGTERRVQRPKDEEKQKKYYSGKKKAHTVKNLIVGGIKSKKVNYLSQTCEGKRHDKKIADDEAMAFPEGASLYKDTGFQGFEPEGVDTFQPMKKPRGKELTPEQKEQNRLISRIRVVIENIIAGVKRCHIVKDLFRNTKDRYDDLVMEIACGLHNFRVSCRQSV